MRQARYVEFGLSVDPMRRAVLVAFARESWWAEFWSASTALMWAGLSYSSVERLADWPSMKVLVAIGSDEFWHALGFGLGVLQLVSLFHNRRWLRWFAALAQGWFWGILTLGVWAAMPWAPAIAVYAGWCGINVFSVLRLLRLPPPSWAANGHEQH